MNEQAPLVQPWQTRLLVLGKLVFTLIMAWQLARFTWLLIVPPTLVLQEPSRATGQSTAPIGQQQSIADWHVFGDATAAPVEVPKVVSAPTTRLRLELLGVMAGGDGQVSSAIIAPKGGSGDYYRVGDVVQGRTKLASVHADKVILDTNGKLETLKFDETRNKQNIQRSAARTPPPTTRPAAVGNRLKDRFSKVRDASDAVNLIKDEVNRDPQEALSQLGLESAGDGAGYRVSAKGSMLTQLGLQPGDVILSVNNQPLGDMSSDQALIENVAVGGQVRLEIQRGDRRFVVNHSLN